MFNSTFFLASDLSPHLIKELVRMSIKSENAREVYLNHYLGQFKHCVANKRVMVTKNKRLFKLCEQKNCPKIFIENGSAKDEVIINEIKKYIRLSKILGLAA